MKALIFDGKVIQVEKDADVFAVVPALKWIKIPVGKPVAPGHVFSAGVFKAPAVKLTALPVKSEVRAALDVLISKGVLTQAEIDAKR